MSPGWAVATGETSTAIATQPDEETILYASLGNDETRDLASMPSSVLRVSENQIRELMRCHLDSFVNSYIHVRF